MYEGPHSSFTHLEIKVGKKGNCLIQIPEVSTNWQKTPTFEMGQQAVNNAEFLFRMLAVYASWQKLPPFEIGVILCEMGRIF